MRKTAPNSSYKVFMTSILFKLLNKKTTYILMLIFFSMTVSGQNENSNFFKIKEVKNYISSLKNVEKNSRSSHSNSQNLENILFNIQPSVYYYSGTAKTYGDNPKCVFTDIASLNSIKNADFLKNYIEIITIKVETANELNSTIDLSNFSNFNNLKYIYIISNVPTNTDKLNKMILNYNDQYNIFYKIDSGE